MPGRIVFAAWAVLLSLPAAALAQEAPLLTVRPVGEQVRRLEMRGDLQMVRKQYFEAIEFYRQALAFEARNPVLLNKTGIAYHHLNKLGDAKKFYKRATKADKKYAQAWNNLGAVYYGEKNYKRAVRYYERALKVDPAYPAFRANLGTALFARKKYQEALEQFRIALLLDPDVFQSQNPLGLVLRDQSVEDRGRFHFLLAKSYAGLGYVERCVRYLRRALEDGILPEEVLGDPGFLPVREDERFQALFEQQPTARNR